MLIKLKIDEHTILALEKEFVNEEGKTEYSIFENVLISLPNKDIFIPRNTTTIHTEAEAIVLEHLLAQRTITPIEATIIYYQVMKKLKRPFFKRLSKWFISLKNLW